MSNAVTTSSSNKWVEMKDLRELSRPNSWRPLLDLGFDWIVILAAVMISEYLGGPLPYFAAIALIAGRQHALFGLVHEAVHKHMAARKWVNDLLANWGAAFPTFFDLHNYRRNHLRHHEHLNTDQDPDLIRKRGRAEWTFPVGHGRIALYLPYFVFIWGPIEWGLAIVHISGLLRGETYREPISRSVLLQKLVFYSVMATALTYFEGWTLFAQYWLVPMFFVFPLLQRMRSVAEHFGLAWTHDLNSARDVLAGPLERLFLAPHHVNYHLCHHLYPGVPGYRLAELQKKLMENPRFAAEAHTNSSYLWGRGSVLADITRPKSIQESEARAA